MLKDAECMIAVDFVNLKRYWMILQELAFIEIMRVPTIRTVKSITCFRCNIGAMLLQIKIYLIGI